jgi:hypothetical protein
MEILLSVALINSGFGGADGGLAAKIKAVGENWLQP